MAPPSTVAETVRVAGVDLGGTKVFGVVPTSTVAIAGDVVGRASLGATARHDTPHGADAIVDAIVEVVAELEAAAGPVAAVGVGAAGQVDNAGILRFAPNLPGVTDLDLGGRLEDRLQVPVVVDNDANCATVAEHRAGAARGARDVVLVTLGTGIGGGVIVGDALLRGVSGFAGEPGHMVVDPAGPPCPCGRRGCWERFASGSGLGRIARDAAAAGRADRVVALAGGDAEAVRGEHVTRAALEGDEGASEIMRQFAWWVAVGVANLVNVLDPEVVVIGGGLAQAGDALLEPTRAAYAGLVLAHGFRVPVRIVGAALGPAAGAVGAAMLAADTVA